MKKRVLSLLLVGVVLSMLVGGCSFKIGNEKKVADIESDGNGGIKITPTEEDGVETEEADEKTEIDWADVEPIEKGTGEFKEEDFNSSVWSIASDYSSHLGCTVTGMLEWKPIPELSVDEEIGGYSAKNLALSYAGNDVTVANDYLKHVAAMVPIYEKGAITDVNTVVTFANIFYEIMREEPVASSVFTLDKKYIFVVEESAHHCIVVGLVSGADTISVEDVATGEDYSDYAMWLINNDTRNDQMYGSLERFKNSESTESTEITSDDISVTEPSTNDNTAVASSDGSLDKMKSRVKNWKEHPYNNTVAGAVEKNGVGLSDAIKAARMIGAAADDEGDTKATGSSMDNNVIEITLENGQIYHVDVTSGALYYGWDLISE